MQPPSPDQYRAALARARTFIERINSIPGPRRLSAGLAYASLKRAHNVLTAIEAIAEKGLVSEVRTLGRVICESAYNMAWVLQANGQDRSAADREERAQLLCDDSILDGEKLTNDWLRHGLGSKEQAEEAARAASEVRERRGLAPNKMLKLPNLYERAREAGGEAFAVHYSVYFKAMCLDSHATIQGMVWVLAGHDEEALGRNLFSVLAVTISLIEIGSQLMGLTEYLDLLKEIESMIGLSFLNAPSTLSLGGVGPTG